LGIFPPWRTGREILCGATGGASRIRTEGTLIADRSTRLQRTLALAKTKAFERSRNYRKRVEMLFAHLKRILRLGRLRLRGPSGAQDEFTLAAIAQNLRRLAKFVVRPPPPADACLA
jgi:Transposase DDE domain